MKVYTSPLAPIAGMRAVELATGAVDKHFEVLAADYMETMLDSCSDTKESEFDQVCADFNTGKLHMVEYMEQKLQCWKVAPWSLAALAQRSVPAARLAGRAILDTFDKQPQQAELHHRVAWQCIMQGSVVRAELERFVAGEEMSPLPSLRKIVLGAPFLAQRGAYLGGISLHYPATNWGTAMQDDFMRTARCVCQRLRVV